MVIDDILAAVRSVMQELVVEHHQGGFDVKQEKFPGIRSNWRRGTYGFCTQEELVNA